MILLKLRLTLLLIHVKWKSINQTSEVIPLPKVCLVLEWKLTIDEENSPTIRG